MGSTGVFASALGAQGGLDGSTGKVKHFAANQAIELLDRPDVLLGGGTLETVQDARRVHRGGAVDRGVPERIECRREVSGVQRRLVLVGQNAASDDGVILGAVIQEGRFPVPGGFTDAAAEARHGVDALVQVVVNAGTIFNWAVGNVELVAGGAAREHLLPPVVARRHRVAGQRAGGQRVRRLVAHVVGIGKHLEVFPEELMRHRSVEAVAIMRTISRGVVSKGKSSGSSRDQALVAAVAQLGSRGQDAAQSCFGRGASRGDL